MGWSRIVKFKADSPVLRSLDQLLSYKLQISHTYLAASFWARVMSSMVEGRSVNPSESTCD